MTYALLSVSGTPPRAAPGRLVSSTDNFLTSADFQPRGTRRSARLAEAWFPLSNGETDRRIRLASKLVALSKLGHDWDSYGAEPPSRDALIRACSLLVTCWDNMQPEDVVPSVEGGVTLIYIDDSRGYAEIEFGNDGEDMVAMRRPQEDLKIWTIRDDLGAIAAVTEIRRLISRRG